LKTLQILSVFILSIVLSCQAQPKKNVVSVTPSEFNEQLHSEQKPQLLDVRTPQEFATQHLENATNANWNDADFDAKISGLNKKNTVFVYCLSGGRSKQAANKLSEMGFEKIVELQGGILKWNAAGLAPKSDKIIGICPQEYKELIGKNKKTIVNFYAEWCAPCKKMTPYLLKMQKELEGKVNLVRLNADENKTIMQELKFDELPVILVYENDKIVYQHTGYLSEDDLRKQIQ
jgi:thioredoxin